MQLLDTAQLIDAAVELGNPVEIWFGRGQRTKLSQYIGSRKTLLVSTARGKERLGLDKELSRLLINDRHYWFDQVKENPDVRDIDLAAEALLTQQFELIVAIGGGSVIDTAKAFSCLLGNGSRVKITQLLENRGLVEGRQSLPLVAIPTTSGTGSEVTPFATIWESKKKKKLSLSGKTVFPEMAIVDSVLTDNLPEMVTISTALDALNQSFEAVWNINGSELHFRIASLAIKLGLSCMQPILDKQITPGCRDRLAQCSLLSGLLITGTRTALCHSISYPLTINFQIPHGIACAFTMPSVLEYNLNYDDGRLSSLARNTGFKTSSELVNRLKEINDQFGVKPLVRKSVGSLSNLISLHESMINPDRANNNLGPVSFPVVKSILENSW